MGPPNPVQRNRNSDSVKKGTICTSKSDNVGLKCSLRFPKLVWSSNHEEWSGLAGTR
jgi:hypothetical protein